MPAIGEGPIAFVDAEGKQYAVPLTAISFEDGVVQSAVVVDGLQMWLAYLVLQGQLTSGPTPAAVDAMVLEARNDGPTGNDIVVEVRDIGPDAVEIKVTEIHLYEGLRLRRLRAFGVNRAGCLREGDRSPDRAHWDEHRRPQPVGWCPGRSSHPTTAPAGSSRTRREQPRRPGAAWRRLGQGDADRSGGRRRSAWR